MSDDSPRPVDLMQTNQIPEKLEPPGKSMTPMTHRMSVAELKTFNEFDEDAEIEHMFAMCVASSDLSRSERKETVWIEGVPYVIDRATLIAWPDATRWPGRYSACPGTRQRMTTSIRKTRAYLVAWFNADNTPSGHFVVERAIDQLKAIIMIWHDPYKLAEYFVRYVHIYTLMIDPVWRGEDEETPPATFLIAWCVAEFSIDSDENRMGLYRKHANVQRQDLKYSGLQCQEQGLR
jgi:hypothetical protein